MPLRFSYLLFTFRVTSLNQYIIPNFLETSSNYGILVQNYLNWIGKRKILFFSSLDLSFPCKYFLVLSQEKDFFGITLFFLREQQYFCF